MNVSRKKDKYVHHHCGWFFIYLNFFFLLFLFNETGGHYEGLTVVRQKDNRRLQKSRQAS
jgi:hypothetical protein